MDSSLLHDATEAVSRGRRSLRIGILSYRSKSTVGGQGVYVDYLSRALAEAGHQVDVLSGPPYPELSPAVALVKIPSLDLYEQPHLGHYALRPRHLLSWADTAEYFSHLSGAFVEPYTFGRRVFAYLKQHRADYDVLLDNQTLAYGTLGVEQRLRSPMVTMIHHPITRDLRLALDAAEDWKKRWLVRRWYKFLRMQKRVAPQLSTITCPSHAAKADIVSEFGVAPERVHPIPLGVDQATFRPMPETPRAAARLVTTASADTPLKGLSVLIEAYHALLPRHPELELVVIGRLRKGAAKSMIAKLGLQERITFRHGLPREELAREFNRATIAVTPSLYEGFGLPAAEAMSCGAPVVVSDGGALPEVAGEAGVVTPKGDAPALARAIDELLAHPERRHAVAEACLQRAQATFDWSAIAPKYVDLFERTMARTC